MAEQDWREAVAEVWQLFKETNTAIKETSAEVNKLKDRFQEVADRFQETDAQFRETDKRINQVTGLFTSQWGKMIEALVQPNALKLFQEWGIKVHRVHQRSKSQQNGQTMELDLLLENDRQVVVIEVKSTLRVGDVQEFMDDLEQLVDFFPRYRDYEVYGAVAGLEIVEEADLYAYRQGLFVLGVVGEGIIRIKNDERFRPKDWGGRKDEG